MKIVDRNVKMKACRKATKISNTSEWLTTIVPSGNIVSTADELSRFFQLLLDGGVQDGVRVVPASRFLAALV